MYVFSVNWDTLVPWAYQLCCLPSINNTIIQYIKKAIQTMLLCIVLWAHRMAYLLCQAVHKHESNKPSHKISGVTRPILMSGTS